MNSKSSKCGNTQPQRFEATLVLSKSKDFFDISGETSNTSGIVSSASIKPKETNTNSGTAHQTFSLDELGNLKFNVPSWFNDNNAFENIASITARSCSDTYPTDGVLKFGNNFKENSHSGDRYLYVSVNGDTTKYYVCDVTLPPTTPSPSRADTNNNKKINTNATLAQASQTLAKQQEHTGGKAHKKYNGRSYLVRTGVRGGKYILVKGQKIYV